MCKTQNVNLLRKSSGNFEIHAPKMNKLLARIATIK
jgi:hypothetical protein